jgi:hypothetical protein
MNGTIISEETKKELKDLARKIENIEIDIFFGDRTDHTLLSHRKLTEQLTELIKTL